LSIRVENTSAAGIAIRDVDLAGVHVPEIHASGHLTVHDQQEAIAGQHPGQIPVVLAARHDLVHPVHDRLEPLQLTDVPDDGRPARVDLHAGSAHVPQSRGPEERRDREAGDEAGEGAHRRR
jgi:hypothetical protein